MNADSKITAGVPLTAKDVAKALYKVIDPEIGLNVVDLGLIYNIQIEDSIVCVSLTFTTSHCPIHDVILQAIRGVVLRMRGIRDCKVNLVWNPPWNPSMISDEGKFFLARAF